MNELKEVVQEFFAYLDHVEETDSGKEFHPVSISCCRVLMTDKLDKCLFKMRRLSHEYNKFRLDGDET